VAGTLPKADLFSTAVYYTNSRAKDFDVDLGGAACIGTGPGCNECITWYQSGGFKVCVWSSFWEDYYCYYYGSPDNQIG